MKEWVDTSNRPDSEGLSKRTDSKGAWDRASLARALLSEQMARVSNGAAGRTPVNRQMARGPRAEAEE